MGLPRVNVRSPRRPSRAAGPPPTPVGRGPRRRQFRFACEKTVGAAVDHKTVHRLRHDHATGTALAFEDGDIEVPTRAHQLPRGGEPGNAGAYYDYPQSQPRCAAAARTTSATA